jgi:aryl-alcohol dehydrogenase-like predicted oxidoreductase
MGSNIMSPHAAIVPTVARPLAMGRATSVGTKRYRKRHAPLRTAEFYRDLDGVAVSALGLGSYLGDPTDADDVAYMETAAHALELGVNVLDSAINYRCQRSERALGAAIARTLELRIAARDEMLVCTKGGYVALDGAMPASREAYQEYLEREYFERGIMAPEDVVGGAHCMAPRFLADQVGRSRRNLGVETIDVYYLHNPEQQLDAVSRERFLARLHEAFAALEDRVKRGDIARYGVATWNGLRVPPGTRGHLSLAELVRVAREAGGDAHHFRVVQLPINLAMTEGVRLATQALDDGRTVPALHAAAELGLSVVGSATLMQGQLTRDLPAALADAFPSARSDAQRALAFVRELPIATGLVGMKCRQHLEENLGLG